MKIKRSTIYLLIIYLLNIYAFRDDIQMQMSKQQRLLNLTWVPYILNMH